MNKSKSLIKILCVLGLLLILFASQTLAVDPYYRPANPVMDFVPQVIINSDPYYDDVKDWSDGFASIKDCKKCHPNDPNLYPEFYQIWGDLRSPHHETQEAEMGQCNACHRSVVEPYSVSLPPTPTSSITTPTPASCENCHFWDDPVNPTIHGIGEIKTWGSTGAGMHPLKLALGFDPDNLPSMGIHEEINGMVYSQCALCHWSEPGNQWDTNPYNPQAIRFCENCHTMDQLHNNQEHVNTNNIYTVNGVPNQTVTADEKCNACHGYGTTISCTLTPDNPPTPSVPRGGTLGFQATVTNNTDEVQVFKFATRKDKPGGGKYPPFGYLKGPVTVRLDPHDSISKHLSQYIPDTAPLGTYTYYGYVGVPGNIYDDYSLILPELF